MEKITRFFIHFWLAVTIASLLYALYMIYTQGWESGSRNLFIPVIAFFWYLFRRSMHRRMQRNLQQKEK